MIKRYFSLPDRSFVPWAAVFLVFWLAAAVVLHFAWPGVPHWVGFFIVFGAGSVGADLLVRDRS